MTGVGLVVGHEPEAWYGKASRIEDSKQFSSILNICEWMISQSCFDRRCNVFMVGEGQRESRKVTALQKARSSITERPVRESSLPMPLLHHLRAAESSTNRDKLSV